MVAGSICDMNNVAYMVALTVPILISMYTYETTSCSARDVITY